MYDIIVVHSKHCTHARTHTPKKHLSKIVWAFSRWKVPSFYDFNTAQWCPLMNLAHTITYYGQLFAHFTTDSVPLHRSYLVKTVSHIRQINKQRKKKKIVALVLFNDSKMNGPNESSVLLMLSMSMLCSWLISKAI